MDYNIFLVRKMQYELIRLPVGFNVNSRVNIMHVKRNQRKPALNGKQSCLYAQKLSLLYRKILFELLQINDSLYLEKLKHCVLNLDNWNSISDDFLSWLSK